MSQGGQSVGRRVFIDAVTLNHFASVGNLDLLRRCCRIYLPPLWVEEVCHEVLHEANPFRDVIRAGSDWLGDPQVPVTEDLRGIVRLQIGLNGGEAEVTSHLGEAQSIYFARVLGADFITDDGPAFDFAQQQLGVGRVRDTIDLLRGAVAMDDLTAAAAAELANEVLDNDRWFRSGRPTNLDERFFEE